VTDARSYAECVVPPTPGLPSQNTLQACFPCADFHYAGHACVKQTQKLTDRAFLHVQHAKGSVLWLWRVQLLGACALAVFVIVFLAYAQPFRAAGQGSNLDHEKKHFQTGRGDALLSVLGMVSLTTRCVHFQHDMHINIPPSFPGFGISTRRPPLSGHPCCA
jgi:hypothetical protein